MSPNYVAERMQTAICEAFYKKQMPYFTDLLGSDWASGKGFDLSSVEDYIEYAYDRADRKYGEIPYRQRWDEVGVC